MRITMPLMRSARESGVCDHPTRNVHVFSQLTLMNVQFIELFVSYSLVSEFWRVPPPCLRKMNQLVKFTAEGN